MGYLRSNNDRHGFQAGAELLKVSVEVRVQIRVYSCVSVLTMEVKELW